MNASMIEILTSAEARAVGIALLHFVWQASLVALLLAAVLASIDKRAASLRYALSCAALFLLVILPVRTAYLAFEPAPPAQMQQASTSTETRTLQQALVTGVTHAVLEINQASTWRERIQQTGRALVDMTPWLVAFWLTGVGLFSIRFAAGIAHAHSLTRKGVDQVPAMCRQTLERVAARLGLDGRVTVMLTSRLDVPAVVGFIRPVVLVPASALTGLNCQQLETILAHELAHVRRHDFLVNLAQSVVETLFFYHPGVWWISRQVRIEREHCCDDLAVSVCGDPIEYARALAALESSRASVGGLAVAASGGSLLNRVRRLVGMGPSRRTPGQLAGAAFGVLAGLAALALPLAFVAQQALAAGERASTTVTVVGERVEVTPEALCEDSGDDCSGLSDEDMAHIHASVAEATEALHEAEEVRHAVIASLHGVEAARHETIAALHEIRHEQIREVLAEVPAITEMALQSSLRALETLTPPVPPAPAAPALAPAPPPAWPTPRIAAVRAPHPPAGTPRTPSVAPPAPVRISGGSGRPLDWNNLDVDDLVAIKVHGVTRSYVDSLRAAGVRVITVDDAVGFRALGITPEFATGMKTLFNDLDDSDLMGLKALNVTPKYVEELRTAGLRSLDASEVTSFKAMGLDAATVRELRTAFPSLTDPEDFISWKAVNITGEWLRQMSDAGLTNLEPEEAVGLKSVGVTGSYIRELRAEGLSNLDADELIGLRALGVTGDYIRDLKAAGLKNLDADRLTELKAAGITAEWLRSNQ